MRYMVVSEQEPDGGYVAGIPTLPAGDPIPTEVGKEFAEVEVAGRTGYFEEAAKFSYRGDLRFSKVRSSTDPNDR